MTNNYTFELKILNWIMKIKIVNIEKGRKGLYRYMLIELDSIKGYTRLADEGIVVHYQAFSLPKVVFVDISP